MKKLGSRLQQLERRMIGGEITCRMAYGVERRVWGRRLPAMLLEMGEGMIREDTQAVLDAVSDNCLEMGHGHMTSVLRVMAAGPVVTPEQAAELDASE